MGEGKERVGPWLLIVQGGKTPLRKWQSPHPRACTSETQKLLERIAKIIEKRKKFLLPGEGRLTMNPY